MSLPFLSGCEAPCFATPFPVPFPIPIPIPAGEGYGDGDGERGMGTPSFAGEWRRQARGEERFFWIEAEILRKWTNFSKKEALKSIYTIFKASFFFLFVSHSKIFLAHADKKFVRVLKN